jgi:hypothetical protein
MAAADDFADLLSDSFQQEAAKATFSEVQLFRALIRAFASLPANFHAEEYHGPKHQVFFNGVGAWARTPARCELCDVVFLAYRTRPTFQARTTFLQAKLSKEKHPALCSNYPHFADQIDFKANLEQWDLLARRPPILPAPPFEAHPLLLQDAVLPSVGSFGVFHRTHHGKTDFYYSSADLLSVVGSPTTKAGRLATNSANPRQRTLSGYVETTYCCCFPLFAKALFSLELGTPVEPTAPGLNPSPLVGWLRDVLRRYLQTEGRNSILAREVLDRIGGVDQAAQDGPMALPSLVLIRAEERDDL